MTTCSHYSETKMRRPWAKAEPVPYARLDNPQTLNLYAYAYDSPVDKLDIDGHFTGDHGFYDFFATEFASAMKAADGVAAAAASQKAKQDQKLLSTLIFSGS